MFNHKWSTRWAVLVGAMMVAMLLTTGGPAMAQATGTHAHSNVGLRMRVDQNITAAVGQPLNFEIAAANTGQSDATNVEVGVPLDLGNLKLTGASFTDASGFVTGVFTDPSINLLTAHMADRLGGGQTVSMTLTFVPQPIALGLTMKGTTSNAAIAYIIGIFSDDISGDEGVALSNRVEYSIAASSSNDGTGDRVQTCEEAPYAKNPAGAINIICRNFAPGERLHFWLNDPAANAVVGTNDITYADGNGEFEIDDFSLGAADQGVPAGDYSFVFHGDSSNVDFVAPFTLK